jgi:hypothetical protein
MVAVRARILYIFNMSYSLRGCGIALFVLAYAILLPLTYSIHSHPTRSQPGNGDSHLEEVSVPDNGPGSRQCDICARIDLPSHARDAVVQIILPSAYGGIPFERISGQAVGIDGPMRDRAPPFPTAFV